MWKKGHVYIYMLRLKQAPNQIRYGAVTFTNSPPTKTCISYGIKLVCIGLGKYYRFSFTSTTAATATAIIRA